MAETLENPQDSLGFGTCKVLALGRQLPESCHFLHLQNKNSYTYHELKDAQRTKPTLMTINVLDGVLGTVEPV